MRFNLIFLLTLVVATFHNARASVWCEYAAYTPSAIQYFVLQALGNQGVAIAPSAYFPGFSSETEDALVVSDAMQFGWLNYHDDPRNGTATLSISDTNRAMVATVSAQDKPCASGICHESRLTIWLGGKPSVLRVVQEPGYGNIYYIGEQSSQTANVTIWRSQFSQSIQWALHVLMDSAHGKYLPTYSRSQALLVLLASDPNIVPYLSFFSLTTNYSGRLVLTGRINQQVYDRIIDMAIEHGFPDIIPDVTIDSAVIVSDPGACYGVSSLKP